MSRPGLGPTHPPAVSSGVPSEGGGVIVKQTGHEVDHSPPFSAEIKNEWSYTCTSPIGLLGMDRDNFIFTFYPFCSLMAQMSGFHNPLREKHPLLEAFNQNILCIFSPLFWYII
jgi:hypothetical protein